MHLVMASLVSLKSNLGLGGEVATEKEWGNKPKPMAIAAFRCRILGREIPDRHIFAKNSFIRENSA